MPATPCSANSRNGKAVKADIFNLASMLDDRDENVGVNILAQLLCRADELGDLPALLQESADPLVRRRAHQLQSALTMRRRRQDLHARLSSFAPELLPGLEELHLLWFDRDSRTELHETVSAFADEFRKAGISTLEEIDFFMRQKNFLPENESTIQVENYCIGAILDRRMGAASVLMALACELAGKDKFQLVRVLESFGIADDRGQLLLGNNSWRFCRAPGRESMELWDNRMLLKYVASTLLGCAVNSDSYRYVMSISQAISGDGSEHVFDGFPYPFRSSSSEK